MRYRRALTIAGSDSGGGAGIQADLKAFAALGCYGMSVITALTAQNTRGVTGILPVAPEFVAAQVDAVLSDIGADAIKLGMLHNAQTIAVVARAVQRWAGPPLVLDPVMVATSGDALLEAAAVNALRQLLMPLATIVTPNLPEATMLLERPVVERGDMEAAARDLVGLGAGAVLLKGGHLPDPETTADVLVCHSPGGSIEATWFESPRIDTPNTHGTGCTLAAAIAACLARGAPLDRAVAEAREYLQGALLAGASYGLGTGHGPVHHFYRLWNTPGRHGGQL